MNGNITADHIEALDADIAELAASLPFHDDAGRDRIRRQITSIHNEIMRLTRGRTS